MIRFSGCRAAATARAAPRQSMPTNPSAMGRIPAPTRPVERHDRSYGPRNTGLAMTVKSFFERRKKKKKERKKERKKGRGKRKKKKGGRRKETLARKQVKKTGKGHGGFNSIPHFILE